MPLRWLGHVSRNDQKRAGWIECTDRVQWRFGITITEHKCTATSWVGDIILDDLADCQRPQKMIEMDIALAQLLARVSGERPLFASNRFPDCLG